MIHLKQKIHNIIIILSGAIIFSIILAELFLVWFGYLAAPPPTAEEVWREYERVERLW